MKAVFLVFLTSIAVGGIAQVIGWDAWMHPHYWRMMVFLAALSVLVQYVNDLGRKQAQEYAFQYYLGALLGRFLITLIAVFSYAMVSGQTKSQLILAALNFFLVYGIYAGMEMRNFLSNLRANSRG